MDMSKYLSIFVSESQDHLQKMDGLLLTLERSPEDMPAIAALFREAHSMKGMSALMGYEGLAEVAHRLEDFLDRCRGGQSRIGGAALEALFEGVDLLRQAVAEAGQSGAPSVDVSAYLGKLAAATDAVPAAGGAAGAASGNARARLLVELVAAAPPEVFAHPGPVYALHVEIVADTPMPAARAYIILRKLAELGEVLRSLPTQGQLQAGEGDLSLAALLASKQSPGAIHRTLSDWVDVAAVTVEPLEGAEPPPAPAQAAAPPPRPQAPPPPPVPPAPPAARGPAGPIAPSRERPAAPQPIGPVPTPAAAPAFAAARAEARPPQVPPLPAPRRDAPPAPAPTARPAPAASQVLAPRPAPAAAPAAAPRPEGLAGLVARADTLARVDTRLLDQLVDQVGELITAKGSLLEEGRGTTSPGLRDAIDRVERLVGSLQRQALKLRMMPFEMIADRFPRAVRDVARRGGKEVDFRLEGTDIELDRSILDHLADPLIHILRNAVDHGLEAPQEREGLGKPRAGVLTLRAAKEGESIFLQIEDDGRGMDADRLRGVAVRKGLLTAEQAAALSEGEALELITRPGFSTADKVTDISGRGVGMDVVKTTIDRLHGSLLIDSVPGEGSTFTLRLPMSLAVIAVLMVRVGPERYAIPMYQVGTTIEVLEEEIQRAQGQEVVGIGGELIPLVRLGRALQCPRNGGAAHGAGAGRDARPAPLYAVLTQVRGRDVGMVVDEILSVQDVLVKPLDKTLRGLRGFAGVTVLGDGSVVLILDLNAL